MNDQSAVLQRGAFRRNEVFTSFCLLTAKIFNKGECNTGQNVESLQPYVSVSCCVSIV